MISRFQAELLAPMLEPFVPKDGSVDGNKWCLPEATMQQARLQESVFDDHLWYEGKGIDGQGRSVHVIDLEGFEQYRNGHVTLRTGTAVNEGNLGAVIMQKELFNPIAFVLGAGVFLGAVWGAANVVSMVGTRREL